VWQDQATFAAREHFIARARITAFLKLTSHSKFLMGNLEAIKVGTMPPAGTKQSMDTIVWAAQMCPEIDELGVVAGELRKRYGERAFRAAAEYSQGHEVDPEVHKRLGHASANPSAALVRQEVVDIAAEEPKLELNATELQDAIGSEGGGGGGGGGGGAAAPIPFGVPVQQPLAPYQQQQQQYPPPAGFGAQANMSGGMGAAASGSSQSGEQQQHFFPPGGPPQGGLPPGVMYPQGGQQQQPVVVILPPGSDPASVKIA
jgi:hypothetical protein